MFLILILLPAATIYIKVFQINNSVGLASYFLLIGADLGAGSPLALTGRVSALAIVGLLRGDLGVL